MIMNRAALSVTPAENQCMIGGTFVHEVAPVTLRRELNECPDRTEIQVQPLYSLGQNIQGNTFLIPVQFSEPLFKRQFHKLDVADLKFGLLAETSNTGKPVSAT